jgi:hypothetical protein
MRGHIVAVPDKSTSISRKRLGCPFPRPRDWPQSPSIMIGTMRALKHFPATGFCRYLAACKSCSLVKGNRWDSKTRVVHNLNVRMTHTRESRCRRSGGAEATYFNLGGPILPDSQRLTVWRSATSACPHAVMHSEASSSLQTDNFAPCRRKVAVGLMMRCCIGEF